MLSLKGRQRQKTAGSLVRHVQMYSVSAVACAHGKPILCVWMLLCSLMLCTFFGAEASSCCILRHRAGLQRRTSAQVELLPLTRTGAMAVCAGYAWMLCYCEGCGHHLVSQTSQVSCSLPGSSVPASEHLLRLLRAATSNSVAWSQCTSASPTVSPCLCRADLLQGLSPACILL